MKSRLSDRAASHRFSAGTDWLGDDRLFTPLGYEPGYDYPLIVWLPDHTTARFDIGRAMKRLSLRNFLAIEPVIGPRDDAATREDAVWRSIDRICDRASVNSARIYLVGQGAGGSEAFRIACRHPQAFGGVVSLGGPFPLEEALFSRLFEVRRLPMLLCCHREAPAESIRHTDKTLRLFHAAGAMLAMRIYPGSNDLSKAILCDVNRWLMDEVCGTSTLVAAPCARQ
jgi:phospholipase/carboxylesterase